MSEELECSRLEPGEVSDLVSRYFLSEMRTGYLRVRGCFMPDHFPSVAQEILRFDVRDDDVWVCSFPKTGTTWTQEMVWCLANNMNFEGAKELLSKRFPFLEVTGLFLKVIRDNEERPLISVIDELRNAKSPRFIKSHLPFNLLPLQLQRRETKAKIITVSRNPKDTCVSYYHHCRIAEGYTGDFKNFTKLFMEDAVCYAPFSDNVLSFWERRVDPNILHLKYEDMKKDLPSVIRKTAEFLGKVYSGEQITKLVEHLSFEKMKNNPSIMTPKEIENKEWGLIRKGQVGGWREEMDPETAAIFDIWTQDKFAKTGLSWQDVL